MSLDAVLIPAILFFALGVFAKVIKSDLKFPEGLSKGLSLYLLVAIGLKGGAELAHAELAIALKAIFWAIVLGFVTPLIGYALLRIRDKIDAMNAAAIAAHYGSVSAGTFLTAIAFLEISGITHENYPIIMMVMMETPAIIIGLVLAAMARKKLDAALNAEDDEPSRASWRNLMHEALTNGSVILLLGSMLIGAVASEAAMEKVMPFAKDIFMGVLCLFLLDLGMEAARRMKAFKKVGVTLVAFGVVMPIIGAVLGIFVGSTLLNFSVGGTFLVAILAASASYIAVPPAMRMGVPEANPSYYLTLALGVTFPFNVLVGIPLYYAMTQWYVG
jgi:hypothetical protein